MELIILNMSLKPQFELCTQVLTDENLKVTEEHSVPDSDSEMWNHCKVFWGFLNLPSTDPIPPGDKSVKIPPQTLN